MVRGGAGGVALSTPPERLLDLIAKIKEQWRNTPRGNNEIMFCRTGMLKIEDCNVLVGQSLDVSYPEATPIPKSTTTVYREGE